MFKDLLLHPAFLSVFFVWLIAGLIKYFSKISTSKKVSFSEELFRTGGMPSAHAGTVTTITASVFFIEGFSILFFVAAVFSVLVIRDSIGVRWSVGEQAKIINKLLTHDNMHKKVKVFMGHTPFQALFGIILGILVAAIMHML